MDDKLYIAHGSRGDQAFDLVVTPEQAGWTYSGLRVLHTPARRDAHLGHRRRRAAGPAAGRLRDGDLRRRELRAAGTPQRVLPRQRLLLRAARRHDNGDVQGRRRVRHPAQPGANDGCRRATARPRPYRSNCAARARPAGRSTTSARPRRSSATSSSPSRCSRRAGTGRPTRRTSTTRRATTRPNSRRSTTSRPPGSATSGSTALPAAPSTCWRRSARATSCSSRTAGTGRRWPRPATTCTTST